MAVGEHARAEEFIDRGLEALGARGTFALELLTWSARAHLYTAHRPPRQARP